MKSRIFLLLLMLAGCARDTQPLVLATTTSIDDTGLLAKLLEQYRREQPGGDISVLAVGSGQALELGRRGDADVLIVHSPIAESTFVAAGLSAGRCTIAQNSFLLVGPPTDSAGAAQAGGIVEAFNRIAAAQKKFASRGDNSGTHERERSIWRRTNIQPQQPWYLSVGQGSSETLNFAHEQGAYTLTDIATYSLLKDRVTLVPLIREDPLLVNRYSVILPRPGQRPVGRKLYSWLIGPEARASMDEFRVAGQQVFFPLKEPACDAPR